MRMLLTSFAVSALLAAFAIGQPSRYSVTDLGTLRGGNFSQATAITNDGLIAGLSSAADETQHAVIWYRGWIGDMGSNGSGGPNSGAFGINRKGQALVQAESTKKDPYGENFCAYGTGLTCQPYLWQNGVMTALPLLGGNNGSVGAINKYGEAAGYAENAIHDAACPAGVTVNGTGPQVLDFKPVIWGPAPGQIRELALLPGDTVGVAMWLNDQGQAAGVSGTCANTLYPPATAGPHAVLWDKDGSVHDLGSLGGTVNTSVMFVGNVGLSINNLGQVVGASALPGNTTNHAFLWTSEAGMQDLGTLPGDVQSGGLEINDRGEVVGASIDEMGNARAFLWRKGVMTDLNTMIPENSPLYLLLPAMINSRGEIVGFGVTNEGDIHAFLATPRHGGDSGGSATSAEDERFGRPPLPESVRAMVRSKLPTGPLGIGRRTVR